MSNGTSVDATVILNDEIKMLDQLIAMIEAFVKDYKPGPAGGDDFNFRNLACWAKELKGYRDIDKQYVGMSKPDLTSALQEEIDVLQKLHDAIESQSAAGQYWKANLYENIWYTRGTLERVKP
jgi:uncharacterized protein YqeY